MAGGKRVSFDVAVPAADGDTRREGIGFVWARQKLAELSLANAVKPAKELQDEMIRFSTETSVLCELTAFLAVDSSAPTAGSEGVSVAVPVPVPAGVKYETTASP